MYNDSGVAKAADPSAYRHRSYTVVWEGEADFRVTWTGSGAARGLDVTPPHRRCRFWYWSRQRARAVTTSVV